MEVQLRFFGSFREAMGTDNMLLSPPADVRTAAELTDWLASHDPAAGAMLHNRARVHLAINNVLAGMHMQLAEGDVIDIFPPVSGG
jgi:sulfur-carrier protein